MTSRRKGAAVDVAIHTEIIKLDSLLKLAGIFPTGGEAKVAIQAGAVCHNGAVCRERGRKIRPGDTVAVGGEVIVVRAE